MTKVLKIPDIRVGERRRLANYLRWLADHIERDELVTPLSTVVVVLVNQDGTEPEIGCEGRWTLGIIDRVVCRLMAYRRKATEDYWSGKFDKLNGRGSGQSSAE